MHAERDALGLQGAEHLDVAAAPCLVGVEWQRALIPEHDEGRGASVRHEPRQGEGQLGDPADQQRKKRVLTVAAAHQILEQQGRSQRADQLRLELVVLAGVREKAAPAGVCQPLPLGRARSDGRVTHRLDEGTPVVAGGGASHAGRQHFGEHRRDLGRAALRPARQLRQKGQAVTRESVG